MKTTNTINNFFEKANFENFIIKGQDSLKTILVEFNTLEKKAQTTTIVNMVEKKLSNYNQGLFMSAVAPFIDLKGSDLYKALFTLEAKAGKDDKTTAKAVYNAITYKFYTLKFDEKGKAFIKIGVKSVNLAEILKGKIDYLSTFHADGKATKEDRQKAQSDLLTSDIVNMVLLWTSSACQAQSIHDNNIPNSDAQKLFDKLTTKYADMNKENPFTLSSKGAAQSQLRELISVVIGTDEHNNKFIKDHATTLQKRTCYIDKKCAEIVESPLNVLQAITIIARYAFNNIPLPKIDKSGIFAPDKTDDTIILG